MTQMSPTAGAYVRSINDHDSAAFITLFSHGAVVNDAGREFRGIAAIKAWSSHDIFDAQVTLKETAGGRAIAVKANVSRASDVTLSQETIGVFMQANNGHHGAWFNERLFSRRLGKRYPEKLLGC